MTFVTGLVDAFSYLVLGHVFVANWRAHLSLVAAAVRLLGTSDAARVRERS